MKKFSQKLVVLLLGFILLFAAVPNTVTVNAAAKNKVTTSISAVQSKAKGFKVTWKKKSKVKGYQIQYSTSKKFPKSKTKTKTVSGSKSTSATISKLSGCGKKYYVRIRTYTVSGGKKVYSSWSSIKTVTTAKHKYEAATCTEAKTCKYCGKTSGKALGHKWKASSTCSAAKTCTVCKKTTGHKWKAATCTKAKTCTVCKKTTGKALGHKWKAATCTKAKTCTVCKKTTGKALGHKWKAATCTKAKTCTVCRKTTGKALGHKWKAATCTKCGALDANYRKLTDGLWNTYVVSKDGKRAMQYKIDFSKKGALGYALHCSGGRSVKSLSADELAECHIFFQVNGTEYADNGDFVGGEVVDYKADGDKVRIEIVGENGSRTPYLELTRTSADQFKVTKVLSTKSYDIPVGTVFTYGASYCSDNGHNYTYGVCSVCGGTQKNYKPLETGVWTGTQVVNGTLYKVTLNFEDAFCGITYGEDINSPTFDASFRKQLLDAYKTNKEALTVIDGEYYYCGSGDGGDITYTVNGNSIKVDCDGYINMSLTRTAGNKLTITKCDIAKFPKGIVLTHSK